MAKYAYNVNNQTKIIDVQKQFPGGLKTVDTDDALGQVYLRKADNVSLSEFSFLEKRHGSYVEQTVRFNEDEAPDDSKPIQGYFEYNYLNENGNPATDRLLFIDGKAYIQRNNGVYNKVENYIVENEFLGSITETEIGGLTANAQTFKEIEEIAFSLFAGLTDVSTSIKDIIVKNLLPVGALTISLNASSGIYEEYTAPSIEFGLTAGVADVDVQIGQKFWELGGEFPGDLSINLGEVQTCPTEAQGLALVEAQFDLEDYDFGTTASVYAFRDVNGNTQICPSLTYTIGLTQGE